MDKSYSFNSLSIAARNRVLQLYQNVFGDPGTLCIYSGFELSEGLYTILGYSVTKFGDLEIVLLNSRGKSFSIETSLFSKYYKLVYSADRFENEKATL